MSANTPGVSQPVAQPSAGASGTTTNAGGTSTRRARLFVTRLEPWSVAKAAFVLSLSLAIVIVVATILIWEMLSLSGTFDAINSTVDDIGGQNSSGFDLFSFVSFGRTLGMALVVAAFEIILTTLLVTLFAIVYNTTVTFTGGVEVTLSENHPVA